MIRNKLKEVRNSITVKLLFSDAEKTFLNKMRVARIATVNPNDNFPHIIPICYAFDEGTFFTSLNKNSKRLKNLKKRNEVSLLLDEYQEKDGEWIILRGILIKIDFEILNYIQHCEDFMKGWTKLIEKYPQYKTWANEDLTPSDPKVRRIMLLKPIEKVSWGFS